MFSMFKKKTETDILQKQYKDLLKKSFELSTINRAESDKVRAQAEEIALKIEAIKQHKL